MDGYHVHVCGLFLRRYVDYNEIDAPRADYPTAEIVYDYYKYHEVNLRMSYSLFSISSVLLGRSTDDSSANVSISYFYPEDSLSTPLRFSNPSNSPEKIAPSWYTISPFPLGRFSSNLPWYVNLLMWSVSFPSPFLRPSRNSPLKEYSLVMRSPLPSSLLR